jgi:hypothetical protein
MLNYQKTTIFRVLIGTKSGRLDNSTVDNSPIFVDKWLDVWRSCSVPLFTGKCSTPIYGHPFETIPRYGLHAVGRFPVEKYVDKLSQIHPQEWANRLRRIGPTSMGAAKPNPHIWGNFTFIHIIHRPYYYYESQLIYIHMLILILEFNSYIHYNDLERVSYQYH